LPGSGDSPGEAPLASASLAAAGGTRWRFVEWLRKELKTFKQPGDGAFSLDFHFRDLVDNPPDIAGRLHS
jgi:hypothetical protein